MAPLEVSLQLFYKYGWNFRPYNQGSLDGGRELGDTLSNNYDAVGQLDFEGEGKERGEGEEGGGGGVCQASASRG